MLALKSIPLEAALPAQSRRRLWSHPELLSHTVLVLTFDRLYLAPLTGSPKPELIAALESGDDLEARLGPLTTVIELVAMRQLKLDLLNNSLNIEYGANGRGRSRLRITFATPEAADACFTKIWRRLGEGFQLASHQRDTWHSIRGPLGVLTLVLLLTAAMAGILSIHEDLAPASAHLNTTAETAQAVVMPHSVRSPWDRLLSSMNWKVICGLGGVAAACSQIWMYRRLTKPPVALELIKV